MENLVGGGRLISKHDLQQKVAKRLQVTWKRVSVSGFCECAGSPAVGCTDSEKFLNWLIYLVYQEAHYLALASITLHDSETHRFINFCN